MAIIARQGKKFKRVADTLINLTCILSLISMMLKFQGNYRCSLVFDIPRRCFDL